MATTKPTPQDEAVNDGPPKFAKLTKLATDAMVDVALDALHQNREMQVADDQGRTWDFRPDGETGQTTLRIEVRWQGQFLGRNNLPSSMVQCDDGAAFIRSAIAILAGAT